MQLVTGRLQLFELLFVHIRYLLPGHFKVHFTLEALHQQSVVVLMIVSQQRLRQLSDDLPLLLGIV